MTRRRGFLTGLLLIAFLGIWTWRELWPSEAIRVVNVMMSRGTLERRIVAAGTLEAVTTVQVGAQVSGTVQSLRADYNSVVHAGDVVATLDPALFDAALGEAQASLGRAQAAEAQAEADTMSLEAAAGDARTKLTRAEALAANELIPQADLDAARTAMGEADTDVEGGDSKTGEAKAAVMEAMAAVGEARVNLDRTVIRSPIDGIVIARHVDAGQTVAAAVQAPVLFTIATDLTRMRLEVDVDEADIGGIEPGERATFEVDAYPRTTFEGTVAQVRLQPVDAAGASSPAESAAVVSYATMIDVANPDERLRPGMTATVVLRGARRADVVRIANSALSFRPSLDVLAAVGQADEAPRSGSESLTDSTRRHVWRFDGRTFTEIEVRAGLSDGQWTELVSGPLGPGDALVASASPGR